MQRTLVSLAAVLLLLSGCASAEPKETGAPIATEATVNDSTGGIEGLVTDDELVPVSGALVSLIGGEPVKTDAGGKFALSNVEPKSHVLIATRLGYFEKQAKADVKPGEVTRVDIVLQKIPVAEPAFDEVMKYSDSLTVSSTCYAEHEEPDQLRGYSWEEYPIPINATKPDGTDLAAVHTVIELKSTPNTATVDIDMYFVSPDGKQVASGESGGPNEMIDLEKLLQPGAYVLRVCFWAGATSEYKITATITYEQGERAQYVRENGIDKDK